MQSPEPQNFAQEWGMLLCFLKTVEASEEHSPKLFQEQGPDVTQSSLLTERNQHLNVRGRLQNRGSTSSQGQLCLRNKNKVAFLDDSGGTRAEVKGFNAAFYCCCSGWPRCSEGEAKIKTYSTHYPNCPAWTIILVSRELIYLHLSTKLLIILLTCYF